ncbi:MAG: aminotransferase class V-fold PLP-dependent enzyme, partial [Methanobacteriota archaeon]
MRPEPSLFEMGRGSGPGYRWPDEPVEPDLVPPVFAREKTGLPTLTRGQVVRHFTRLSRMNLSVDTGTYPLGSCTMKYNPKLMDEIASAPEATDLHPALPEEAIQGSLEILYRLQEALGRITGMPGVSLQPAAGAHGEFTGILVARAFHESRRERRTEVIVPDSAHGTNPASAAMAGFDVVEIPTAKDGRVDLPALEAALSERTAAFMITNPSTLGLFETQIAKIQKRVHEKGALLYYDGANLNAILGITN